MTKPKQKSHNPYDDERDRDIPKSVKRWVLVPVICFTGAGTGALFYIFYLLASGSITSEFAWPALIIAFAGLPSAVVTQVKNLMEAAKATTS